MYNFVIFGLSRWNIELGCNIKDISFELSKFHRVLYIDVPLKRKERWFKRSKPSVKEVEKRIADGKALIEISKNLWHYIDSEILESVNGIKNSFLFDLVNRMNGRRFARSIRKAVEAIGFKEYILINDNDIYNGLYLKRLLVPSRSVYYLRDHLPAMDYWKIQATRLEPMLIKDVDLVVANSQYLADYAKAFNPQSYYVGQGCDTAHFLAAPDKNEIQSALGGIRRPIVGYIGALNSERLDLELLHELAMNMREFSFVLVGQEDAGFTHSTLHKLQNVTFLGSKDFAELPKLLHGFDVAINPQAINEITAGNYPRKVDEYLAAGKPVVATETKTMKPFADHVYLATNASDFEALIRKALTENTSQKELARKDFAALHTWENSVSELMKAVELVME